MAIAHQTRVLLVMTAQVVLSVGFVGGYFALVWQFMVGNVHVPDDFKDAFLTLLGVLTGGVSLVLSYWFSRQREQSPQSSPGAGGS